MSETLDKFKKKFGKNKVPGMLADLCGYWDENPEFFAGSFEVSADEYDRVKEWFRGNEAGYSRVIVFGHDGIGSLFALWLYDGKTSENAPIIYLGGEGVGTTILADDFSGLFSVLASNRDYEPFDGAFCDAEEENKQENRKFRKWIKEKYAIIPAKYPMKIVKAARQNHPDLKKWLTEVIPGWK